VEAQHPYNNKNAIKMVEEEAFPSGKSKHKDVVCLVGLLLAF
jgi:hypothetical protein